MDAKCCDCDAPPPSVLPPLVETVPSVTVQPQCDVVVKSVPTTTVTSSAISALPWLDPRSENLLRKEMPKVHKHPAAVVSEIERSLTQGVGILRSQLNCDPETSLVSGDSTLSYKALIEGLVLPGERVLLDGHCVTYRHLSWKPVHQDHKTMEVAKTPESEVETWTGGRVFLTERRLLFLSSEEIEGGSVKQDPKRSKKGVKRPPGGYEVSSYIENKVRYFPVDVTACKGVNFHYEKRGECGTRVAANNPFMSCCCCYCCCSKEWESEKPFRTWKENTKVISIGLLLPPWGQKVDLDIHVTPDMSLLAVRDFVEQLQILFSPTASLSPRPPAPPTMV